MGSMVNDGLKYVGNNNLASAFGAYKAYSAYRVIRSNLSVAQKVLAVAETALPFVARPIAEAIVAATGTEYSAGIIQTGITLAPTAARVAVEVPFVGRLVAVGIFPVAVIEVALRSIT